MKRILFLTTALSAAASSPAWALFGAGDTVFDPTNYAQLVQQVQTATNQLNVLNSTYGQITSVAGALMHPTNIMGMATGLQTLGITTPLPQIGSVMNMVNGGNPLAALSGLANSLRNQNMVYQPTGTDPAAQWINQGGTQTATFQAGAMQLVQAAQARVPYVQQMMTELQGAQDLTTVEAIRGRIDAEAQIQASQQAQLSGLTALADLQDRVRQEQALQANRRDADQLFADTQPVGAGAVASNGAVQPASDVFAGTPSFGQGG